MNNDYERALNKIHLDDNKKEEMKQLFKKSNMRKKTIMKPIAAIAACMALVVGLGGIGATLDNGKSTSPETNSVTNKNSFSITAYAKELDNKNAVTIDMNDSDGLGTAFCSTEKHDEVSYCISMPFECKGDNIKEVTYKINKGAFQISAPKDNTTIKKGKKCKPLNTCAIGSDDDKDIFSFYKEYTVDYKNQCDKNMFINICGITPMNEDEYFGEHSLKEELEATNKILKGIVITCQVEYKDGTTMSKDIVIENKIMTFGEAYKNYHKPLKNKKTVVVGYKLK